jgi:hypothetical protein
MLDLMIRNRAALAFSGAGLWLLAAALPALAQTPPSSEPLDAPPTEAPRKKTTSRPSTPPVAPPSEPAPSSVPPVEPPMSDSGASAPVTPPSLTPGGDIGDLRTRARNAADAANWSEAVIAWNAVLEKSPNDAEATAGLQMAKTNASLTRLAKAGLPYISVLTDPTMGGVSASFAFVGDVVIAEPKGLVGFAGPRVIEQTVREKLPEGFQRSEFLQQKGAIDMVLDRRQLRAELARLMAIMTNQPVDAVTT